MVVPMEIGSLEGSEGEGSWVTLHALGVWWGRSVKELCEVKGAGDSWWVSRPKHDEGAGGAWLCKEESCRCRPTMVVVPASSKRWWLRMKEDEGAGGITVVVLDASEGAWKMQWPSVGLYALQYQYQ